MFEEFKKVLVDQMNLDPAQITEKAELVNDLGINSLELADLVFTCEEKWNIEIDEEDFQKFVTVGDVVSYLEEKRKKEKKKRKFAREDEFFRMRRNL